MPHFSKEQIDLFEILKKEAFTFAFRPVGETGTPMGFVERFVGIWKDLDSATFPARPAQTFSLLQKMSLSQLREVLIMGIPGADISEDDLWSLQVEQCPVRGVFARLPQLSDVTEQILEKRFPRSIIIPDSEIRSLFSALTEKHQNLSCRINELFPDYRGSLSETEFQYLESVYPQLRPIIEIFKGNLAIPVDRIRRSFIREPNFTNKVDTAVVEVFRVKSVDEVINEMPMWSEALYSGLLNSHEIIVEGTSTCPKEAVFSGDLRKLAHSALRLADQ